MRIAYILSATNPNGGATKAFLSLLQGLTKKGIEPLIVCPDKNGIYNDFITMGIPTLALPYRPATYPYFRTIKERLLFAPRTIARQWLNRKAVKNLAQWLKDQNVDMIHTNVGIVDIGFKASRALDIPHIYHIREYADKDFGMHYFPNKRFFQKQLNDVHSYSICITKDIQNYHGENGKETSQVIYDGVHHKIVTFTKEEDKNYILYAGRIEYTKGLDLLLEAYAKAIKECKKDNFPKLKVAGFVQQQLFYEKLKHYIEIEKISEKVQWMGEVIDLKDYMRHAKALIIPSRSEGFGLCMPEAMFEGCLCVGHNTGGTKEQLDNGLKLKGKEIALRYNTTNELAGILKALYDGTIKKEETDSMTADAFDVVNKLYSTEANVENVFNFYNKILCK